MVWGSVRSFGEMEDREIQCPLELLPNAIFSFSRI